MPLSPAPSTVAGAVDLLQLIGEPTRVRLLSLLETHELTVAEIVGVTQLAQSSVSTHLGKLREAGLVRDRKAGPSTFYSLSDGSMPVPARRVWELVRGEVRDALLEGDGERASRVVRARDRAAQWPDAMAGQMERHWSPGRTWESLARAMAGLVRLDEVVDIGSGDGSVAQLLAPRARSWTCVDRSERVIAAARERLGGPGAGAFKNSHREPASGVSVSGSRREAGMNVRFVAGDAQDLPLRDASFDTALLLHVLTQIDAPARACAEAARVLRPGGTMVVVTLDAHDQADVTAAYGDVHPGFAPAALRRLLTRAGLRVAACDVTSRDARPPCFRVVTALATRPERGKA